jgi:hypothetical protein
MLRCLLQLGTAVLSLGGERAGFLLHGALGCLHGIRVARLPTASTGQWQALSPREDSDVDGRLWACVSGVSSWWRSFTK